MIGFLHGIVHSYGIDWLLLDVNGVGYRIFFYHPDKLKVGAELFIYTYQHVREDELSLYGFIDLNEYDLFNALISVKGLGPKTVANALACASINDIKQAIENGDITFIKKLPGIGNKTAQQIILDLKGKISIDEEVVEINPSLKDALAALKTLGYKQGEIESIKTVLVHEQMSTNEYIKKALALLAK